MTGRPLVSVIVPARDAERLVAPLLEALLAQTYPRDRVQIILADNGSRDATVERARAYPVDVVVERRRSSYAARNLGLRHARGEVIAFTDADCIPDPAWIDEGVRALAATGADLIAGRVRFILSHPPTGAEAYDALVHMDNERLVRRQGIAVTANLFVRAPVFPAAGDFPLTRSGGDAIFTRRAVEKGFRLDYAPAAVVEHPARGLRELLQKSWRVGTSFRARAGTPGRKPAAVSIMRSLLPPTPGYLRRLVERRGTEQMHAVFLRLWGAAWLYGMTWGLSAFVSMVRRAAPADPSAQVTEGNSQEP